MLAERDEPLDLGSVHDQVRLRLGGDELRIVESYDVETGVFTQPSGFSINLGDGNTVGDLYKRYPPRTPFELYIGDIRIQTGFTDVRAAGGQAGSFQIRGRDVLQEIHDSYTTVEKTYKERSHVALIKELFKDAGLDEPDIYSTNEANRKAQALGKKLPLPAKAKEEVDINQPVQIKMGDTFYGFLKRILDRAGLFFFAAHDGSFILSSPDRDQDPLYRVLHAPENRGERASVTDYYISDSSIGRVAYYFVYSRGGGKLRGRTKYKGGFPDEEMAERGYVRSRTFRDWHLQNNEQAELMARRKIADERRKAFQLNLTVVGHTTTSLFGQRAVWTPDTMVMVDSDLLGIHGNYYIESCAYRRSSDGTRTELRLMRPEDLIFGLEDA